jgi:hypothetical protein
MMHRNLSLLPVHVNFFTKFQSTVATHYTFVAIAKMGH